MLQEIEQTAFNLPKNYTLKEIACSSLDKQTELTAEATFCPSIAAAASSQFHSKLGTSVCRFALPDGSVPSIYWHLHFLRLGAGLN